LKYFFPQLHTQSDGTTVHTVQMDGQSENMQVDLSEALAQDGQLLITNEDGNGKNSNKNPSKTLRLILVLSVFPVGISGMITLPVTPQMYHSLVQQQIPNSDNTVCVPMQVQNFVSSNNLCGSIANSNLNTTYIMTTNNRNVINLPLQSSITKSITQSPSATHIYSPKSQTIVKKTYLKKRILSLPASRPKQNQPLSQVELKKPTTNNNSSSVKNRNSKLFQPKYEKLQTSQIKHESRNESTKLDDGDTKVKQEEKSIEKE
jgi:hypothetical protein